MLEKGNCYEELADQLPNLWDEVLSAVDQFPDTFELEKAPVDKNTKNVF